MILIRKDLDITLNDFIRYANNLGKNQIKMCNYLLKTNFVLNCLQNDYKRNNFKEKK